MRPLALSSWPIAALQRRVGGAGPGGSYASALDLPLPDGGPLLPSLRPQQVDLAAVPNPGSIGGDGTMG